MKFIFIIAFLLFFAVSLIAQPGTLLKTLPSPTTQLADLTWDGSDLYLLGLSDHIIYQIDTTNGSVLNTIGTGLAGALGLTYKDGYFWLSVITDHTLKKIDANGSVIKSVSIPAAQNIGIEWDGNAFRVADSGSPDEKILEVDSLGNLLSSFLFPGDSPFGLTWDGNTVWCADNQTGGGVATIYQFDPASGSVITSFPCPNSGGAANGLAWDGEYLWIADQTNDLIYKVEGNPIIQGPQIAIHPDSLDFDTTLTGYKVVRELTIRNVGTDTLSVLDIVSTDPFFDVDTTHFQILPADSFILPVTFLPFIHDFYSAQLYILSDDPVQDTVSVHMQGWGVDPPIIDPIVLPDSISVTIPEGDSVIVDVKITNNLPVLLSWKANVFYLPGTLTSLNSQLDTLFATDVTALTQTNDISIRGVVYDLSHFWVTGSDLLSGVPKLYQFDSNWNLLNTYNQKVSDPFGYRELVFDGLFLYGTENNQLIQIDRTSGDTTGFSIVTPLSSIWAVAYDPATDQFWASDAGQTIHIFDRMGNILNQFMYSGPLIHGMVWDTWSPGGPFVWIWVADGPPNGPNCTAIQLDVNSGQPIKSFSGFEMNGDPNADDQPAGATFGVIDNQVTFVGLQLSNYQPGDGHDFAVGYSLGLTPHNWLTISPDSGLISPWSHTIVQAKIYGVVGTEGGNNNRAYIWFDFNDPFHPFFKMSVHVTVSPLGGLKEKQIYPETFRLNQNYPNPFNPSTTISYQVPVGSNVELTIYNLLGQQIRKLVKTKQPAGTYKVQWDGTDYAGMEVASGVYIYHLKAGDFIQSKKMLLIR